MRYDRQYIVYKALFMKPSNRIRKKTLLPAIALGVGVGIIKYRHKLRHFGAAIVSVGALSGVVTSAYAQVDEQSVMAYAQSMQAAANAQNITQIARLIDDDVAISLTRQGKGSSTLSKNDYLDLLQKSWTQAKNYRYDITVSDIIIAGNQMRAVITTKETWTKDGKTHSITTNARATFVSNGKHAVLKRSVAQVTVE